MDTKETAQLLLETVLDIQKTMSNVRADVSTLNERSKNFYTVMEKQEAKDASYFQRIETLEKKVAVLERDRWWLGFLSSTIGGIITFILSKLWVITKGF